MITRDIEAFLMQARSLTPDFGPSTPRMAFLVSPDGFALADESAQDNAYMADAQAFDAQRALQQHRALHQAISSVLPTVVFAGHASTPDAVFPNNVFATADGHIIIGRMQHPVRQREALRRDIRGFFTDVLGLGLIDLSRQAQSAELTGSMVIDRARGIGFCGLSSRCSEEGARLIHDAFGLRSTLVFDLAEGEYHTNVVLAILAGRAALICPDGFADVAVAQAIGGLYAPHAMYCNPQEHRGFVANSIALGKDMVWMSETAERALAARTREGLRGAGLEVRAMPLDAIEAAGGSLRCCIGELY